MSVHRIFLAGATGAIGRRLVPLLLQAGHTVVGTTRTPAKAQELRAAGVEPVVVDVYDAPALTWAVMAARPNSYATTTKASRDLKWNADFRIEG